MIKYDYQECKINEEGNLIIISTKKEGVKEIFSNLKSKLGGALSFFSIIGLIFSGVFFPYVGIPVCLSTLAGGAYIIKNSVDKQKEEEENKINKIIENEKIKEEIKKQFEEKGWEIY